MSGAGDIVELEQALARETDLTRQAVLECRLGAALAAAALQHEPATAMESAVAALRSEVDPGQRRVLSAKVAALAAGATPGRPAPPRTAARADPGEGGAPAPSAEIECPSCGQRVEPTDADECPECGAPLTVDDDEAAALAPLVLDAGVPTYRPDTPARRAAREREHTIESMVAMAPRVDMDALRPRGRGDR